MKRYGFAITGQVQGVGFRPFVYKKATTLQLTGHVGNTPQGVVLEVQGSHESLERMRKALCNELPPLARIASLTEQTLPLVPDEKAFCIIESQGNGNKAVLISPDMGTCNACLEELFTPGNRRYLYPFINCTDCGPRLTITKSIPYDRATTSMACFPQCPVCLAEYTNPLDRRFHAQPNACPVCGPRLWLTNSHGHILEQDMQKALLFAVRAMAQGAILAVKGLGGFQLACSASNDKAIAALRERKARPHQSFAVMVDTLETAGSVAVLSKEERAALLDQRCPIVAVQNLIEPSPLSALVAPDLAGIGLMLPYTPLHHVLLALFAKEQSNGCAALIMTSGNVRGEPLCLGNREALAKLGSIADVFLLHDRDIVIRADDSVLRVDSKNRHVIRRARGFVPDPMMLPDLATAATVLAVGAELKNTVCLTRGNEAFVSQHLGDMEHLSTHAFFAHTVEHLKQLLHVTPGLVVCDAHPDYYTTQWAREHAAEKGLPLCELQHHCAHIHSVLAEHKHTAPALGLALDGAGYGPDGTVWGGELLLVHPEQAGVNAWPALLGQACGGGLRLGRLRPFALPGGDAAAKEPWRVALGLLLGSAYEHEAKAMPWLKTIPLATQQAVCELLKAGQPRMTSSCGRLFDAVSAVLGLCSVMSYEGQGAIRLEMCQHGVQDNDFFDVPILTVKQIDGTSLLELDSHALFHDIVAKFLEGMSVSHAARRFHVSLAHGLAKMARLGADVTGLCHVGLSGGVLHNITLSALLSKALQGHGLTCFEHMALPPGDGGISFGQAVWARFWLQNRQKRPIVT